MFNLRKIISSLIEQAPISNANKSAHKKNQISSLHRLMPARFWGLSSALITGFVIAQVEPSFAQNKFVHPGITLTKAELDSIKKEVNAGAQPRKSGWDKMKSSSLASLSYQSNHKAKVLADGGTSDGFSDDSAAILSQAIQWYVTGDKVHAEKAIEMMNNWSRTLKSIAPAPGGYNLQHRLVTSWVAQNFAEAGEIIRYTYSGWDQADIDRYERMLSDVFWPHVNAKPPTCRNYGPGCQFQGPGNPRASNQEASYAKAQLAIAVFLDDQNKFNAGLERYRWVLPRYVDSSGEANETCRDQGHTQMGLGELAQAAEIGWSQGIDLYGELNNRLAIGHEYTAKVLSGIPQQSHCGVISKPKSRVYFSWESPFNHYTKIKGLDMTYSAKMVDKTRPTGYWFSGFAWQTLTHASANGVVTPLPPPQPLPEVGTTVFSESFASSAANFTVQSGGAWSVSKGLYKLTKPATFGSSGNGNISVHKYKVSGDFTLTAKASVTPTSSNFDDFSIIFDFQDSQNYYYASFNESNDAGTNGIFKVSAGEVTQIADMGANITAGTTYTVQVVKDGNTVKVYRDDILQATANNSATSGLVGFGSRNNAATFDQLQVAK